MENVSSMCQLISKWEDPRTQFVWERFWKAVDHAEPTCHGRLHILASGHIPQDIFNGKHYHKGKPPFLSHALMPKYWECTEWFENSKAHSRNLQMWENQPLAQVVQLSVSSWQKPCHPLERNPLQGLHPCWYPYLGLRKSLVIDNFLLYPPPHFWAKSSMSSKNAPCKGEQRAFPHCKRTPCFILGNSAMSPCSSEWNWELLKRQDH